MTTIKTDQETGVTRAFDETGRQVIPSDVIRDEKIEEAIKDSGNAEDLITSLHELNCTETFIGRMLLDKFGKQYVAEYLVEMVTDPYKDSELVEKDAELDSALQCIQANFNIMETQINLHRKCGNTFEAGILQGMLDILIISSQDMITLKAKRQHNNACEMSAGD